MERADAKGFVTDFNRTYEEKTKLRRICGHRFYGSEEDDEEISDDSLSYFQIGRRTALPVSLVEEGRYSYVSDAVVGALCEGEKSFLAERLSVAAEDDGLPTVDSEPRRTVEAALGHVEKPNHVLLPRTEAHDEAVERWKEEERLRRLGDESYLRAIEGDEEEETDCWLHRYDPTQDAGGTFVIDDTDVTVVQKKAEDAEPPKEFRRADEYDDLNDDMPLGVYFGDERSDGDDIYDEFLDIVYRVVLSEPVVSDGGVCRVR